MPNNQHLHALFSAAESADDLQTDRERARRWRLILGKEAEAQPQSQEQMVEDAGNPSDGEGESEEADNEDTQLSEDDQGLDDALDALYGGEGDKGGMGDSAPDIARWLGDVRRYFSAPVAQMLQQDAIRRLNLRKALMTPELLTELQPDLELVTKIVALSHLMPAETRETARQIVRQVVEELKEKLSYPLHQALNGSINRALRARRPRRQRDINWLQTIHANLKHYQVEQQTIIPETLMGYGKQRSSLRDVILCIDQSGSMAKSVVYAGIFGSVMASVPALDTRLVLFDTNVADLTGELQDPVDLLFGIRLRGGTDINKAVTYCQQHITRPRDTIFILISDLYEGGKKENVTQRVAELLANEVKVIVLLALSDEGAPRFNRKLAQELSDIGAPAFACTPALFPDLMAAAINDEDIGQWAAGHNIVTAPRN